MKQFLLLFTCLFALLFLTTFSQNQKQEDGLGSLLGRLELHKASQDAIFTEENWHIWGADVIKVNNVYYMLYSRWPEETGMAGWLTHSEIALASAKNASGPFKYQKTVFRGANNDSWDGGMVHSPQVLEYEDKFYLYYTGVPKKPASLGDVEARQYLKDTRRLGLAVAENLEGPWQRFENPLIQTQSAGDLDSLATANPAIIQKEDGNFLLIYKGIKQEDDHQTISLLTATSDSPLGPFTVSKTPILDNSVHVEDPDIWQQNGNYYMIAHDVTGHYSKASDGRSLALFHSSNGLDWQPTEFPLASRRRVQWDDDSTTYFQRFERPHILTENGISGDGKAAMVYVAVKEKDSRAYNVAVPLELK